MILNEGKVCEEPLCIATSEDFLGTKDDGTLLVEVPGTPHFLRMSAGAARETALKLLRCAQRASPIERALTPGVLYAERVYKLYQLLDIAICERGGLQQGPRGDWSQEALDYWPTEMREGEATIARCLDEISKALG